MSPLSSEDRRKLLECARRAIVEAVCRRGTPEVPVAAGALGEPSGAFVTLEWHGRLRGCIGQVQASDPLAATVVNCAVAAALADPRFQPLNPEELPEVEIEISVLSPLEPAPPESVEVGRHGLFVARGDQRGLLLPQVATQYHWTRERFLEETCVKAGLEPDSWKDSATRLWVFTAEVFSETDFQEQRGAPPNE